MSAQSALNPTSPAWQTTFKKIVFIHPDAHFDLLFSAFRLKKISVTYFTDPYWYWLKKSADSIQILQNTHIILNKPWSHFTQSLLLSRIWRFSPEFGIFSKSSRNCPEFWDLEALEDKYTGRDCEDDSYKKESYTNEWCWWPGW